MGANNSRNNSTRLNEEKIESLLRLTKFKRDEIENYQEKFYKDCPNGKLKKRQFVNALKTAKNSKNEVNGEILYEKLFKLYDLDRNGFVDIYEYLLGVNIDQQKKFEDKLSNLFKIYDKNNIGLLDKSDYEKISKHVISLHNCKTFYNSYNKNVESKQVKELVNVLGKHWTQITVKDLIKGFSEFERSNQLEPNEK